jgi:hypothetical protein
MVPVQLDWTEYVPARVSAEIEPPTLEWEFPEMPPCPPATSFPNSTEG